LKNNKLYIGFTADLRKRIDDHNSGIGGQFTSQNKPWKLIYYEAYLHKEDAYSAEKYYKTGIGRMIIKRKLQSYLN